MGVEICFQWNNKMVSFYLAKISWLEKKILDSKQDWELGGIELIVVLCSQWRDPYTLANL